MKRLDRLLLAVVAACLLVPLRGVAAGVGDPAPGFALPDAAGGRVSLDALRGQVVYVDFWASWCGPCRRSFPWMNELQRKYGGKGLAVVAVNVDKRREDAQKFLAQLPPAFTVAYDAAGSVPAAFDVKAMPTSYLIDADGRVAAVEQGFRDERASEIESRIRALLAARRP